MRIRVFAPHRLAAASQPTGQADPDLRAAQQAVADCQRKLARHRAALEAGGDPAVISQWIAETIQRIRHTHHLPFAFLRHCGLSLW